MIWESKHDKEERLKLEQIHKLQEAKRAMSLMENAAKLHRLGRFSVVDALMAISKEPELQEIKNLLIQTIEVENIWNKKLGAAAQALTDWAGKQLKPEEDD